MKSVIVSLPELPKDINPEIKDQKYIKYDIEKPELFSVEKVGERLMKYQQCLESGFDKFYEDVSKNENEDIDDDSDYEEETPELLKLNPYNWKSQDHYAVLGLSKLRINATEEDIKKAYRKKVLRHHPDKKASDGNTNNDSFFKCIQKAYEIITDPVKRRQFDSVDPEFDESIPTKCSKEEFFDVLTPVFERNSRFSNIQPVPSLGDMNSTREEVEGFYRFWSNFDSWRSFEYLDEEDTENYENREDRRYFERKNKNARAKHKKEDNQRIINLIDLAVRTDPRLALYKKADREAKEAKRLEKRAAQIAAAEEEKRRKEEEEKAKENAILEEKERIAREKKEKEMKKRVIRKEKKTLKKFLQDNNYLIDPATPASAEQIESQLKKLDEYISQMDADNLTAYRVYLLRASENGWEAASTYFNEDHLNEGEKYAAELATMAPVEEEKEEVKKEVVEEIKEEKKEPEVEKVEVVEEKKEPEVKKPEVTKMLKKLPSISRIGGMRRTKKKIIRKEYDSEEEEERERELEKEKEQNAPATSSKKKNKKKKKSKKKNSSEELKVNVDETSPITEETTEIKEEIAAPTEDSATTEEVVAPVEEPKILEEIKEEVAPVEEQVSIEENKEVDVPVEQPAVEEIKEETPAEEPIVAEEVTPTEEVKEEVNNVNGGMYKIKSIYGVIPDIDTKTKMYSVKSIYGDNINVDLPLTAEETVKEIEEDKKEEIAPVEEKTVVIEEQKKEEAPVEAKPETKKSKKIKKKKSKARLEASKPKEEKKEEKKVEKKEEKKPQEPVKPKEEILKEVKKIEEENAKRIKDILKKKISMGKLRSKKSSRKLREEKKEEEKKEEQKEELTISFGDDKKKTKAERKAEKAAKKAAKKAKEQEDNEKSEEPVKKESVETPAETNEEPVKKEAIETPVAEIEETPVEIRGMYKVKPIYGYVPKIDTKTKMFNVKSIYGDEVNVDLPLTANQRLTGEESYGIIEEIKEKTEAIEEVNEDKTEVIEKADVSEEVNEDKTEIEESSEEQTEIIESPSSEEKVEVETIEQTKSLRRCPSGISLKPWTPEQQTKLEEALLKFPTTQFKENPMDRWIEISNYVGRSRTDIKFRIKDLADSIRRKRSIQSLKSEN